MDRLDEDFVESDVVQRDSEAITSLLENGKGLSKYLQDIIKFHEKILTEENDHSKNLGRTYITFRPWTANKTLNPLKKIYESSTFQSSQCMCYFDEAQHAKACQVLEELKTSRCEFIAKCKACKDQWKSVNLKVNEARDAHKTAKVFYNRLGRELERLGHSMGEESSPVDGSATEILEMTSLEHLDNMRASAAQTKRERQKNVLESRFLEAEEEYRSAVRNLLLRLNDRSDFHVRLLMALRKAFRDVDTTVVNTEKTLLALRKEKLHESLVKIESQLNSIREYKPQACYLEWVDDRMQLPIASLDEVAVTFVPHASNGSYKERVHSSPSIGPQSPSSLLRARQSSPNICNSQEVSLSAADLRDSVDGSSDGSTPGSTRKEPLRNSYDSASKTPPEGAAGEEEARSAGVTTSAKSSWLPKPLRNILGGRGGSAGSGSSSPPPSSSSQEDDLQKAEQVVALCTATLEKRGLGPTGLYRKGAGEARTNKVLSQLEESMDDSILEEEDPHLICNVIKKVFLKLREPLFTEALYSRFVQVGANIKSDDVLSQLRDAVSLLPRSNRRLACNFIHHLSRIADDPDNQMTADSLGTCVATLIHTRNPVQIQSVPNSKAITAIANTDEIRRVLTLLIENVDQVFDPSDRSSMYLRQESKFVEEVSLSMSSPLPFTSNTESISEEAKCLVNNSRQTTDSVSTSSQISCSVYYDWSATSNKTVGRAMPLSTSACCSPPPTDVTLRSASTSICPSSPLPAPARDCPPPVPPSLGRPRTSETLPSMRKYSSDNKPPGPKSRGLFKKFRRNKSLDADLDADLDRAKNHGGFDFPTENATNHMDQPLPPPPPSSPTPSADADARPFGPLPSRPPSRSRAAPQTKATPDTRRIFVPNGPRVAHGPPPSPPPKPPRLSQGHRPFELTNGLRLKRLAPCTCEAVGATAAASRPLARRNSEPVDILSGEVEDDECVFGPETDEREAPRDRRALSHPLDLAEDVRRRLPRPRSSQPEFV